jgi:hypothetical protein
MAPPIPWTARKKMRVKPEHANPASKVPPRKRRIPRINIRLLPHRSATLPTGNRLTAVTRRYTVTVQPRVVAPREKVSAILGRARFTAEDMKAIKKEARVEAERICF